MKASIRSGAGRMPEGVYHRALKAEVEVVEGDTGDLLWDLVVYRRVLQRVIDALWDLDAVPEKSQAHQMFYGMLREYEFRAHVARNIYSTAIALVESARDNKGSKPVIRRLTARLDHQDTKVDLDSRTIRIIIRDKWYTLKIKHRGEYIERFKGLRWKEVHVKYYDGKLYASIVFETRYAPYTPRGIIALDLNLRHTVSYDGSEVRRYRTRFIDALGKRARAEEIQRKYSKRWRYNEKILNRVRDLHRRTRNIIVDWCRKLAKEIVLKARRHGYVIALEDLEGLRESFNDKSSKVAWKLAMLAYRKLQESITGKAIEYNVPIVFVDPRNTSSTCPRCGSKIRYVGRLGICHRCGFIADRDKVGAMNIWLRALEAYAGVPGSPLRAPAVKDGAGRSRGIRHEGMKKAIKSI